MFGLPTEVEALFDIKVIESAAPSRAHPHRIPESILDLGAREKIKMQWVIVEVNLLLL